jgi:hypothetical protein
MAKTHPDLVNTVFHYMGDRFLQSALEGWDTSRVTNLTGVFYNARTFNQPIQGWGVSQVTDKSVMFEGATAFYHPLGRWDMTRVTKMDHTVEYFQGH